MAPRRRSWNARSVPCAIAFARCILPSAAVYLPGIAPSWYPPGGPVDLKVNKLTSVKTQLPYSYYTLPFCKPVVIQESVENLGEIMEGDVIENSPYEINMLVNETCKVLCSQRLGPEEKEKFKTMIDDEYLVNWIVDNLPAATRYAKRGASQGVVYMNGFPVGVSKGGSYHVHNHVILDLQYHQESAEEKGYRIVGFEVEPFSLQHTRNNGVVTCPESGYNSFELNQNEVTFTYDVRWTESSIRWASRWDNYLKMSGAQIHWFSILNALMIMLFLSGMVAMILLRTLHRDITKYNEIAGRDEASEETGWKLVHGDVFRKPRHSKFLAVSIGSGVQILLMSVVTLLFALLGFLSPAHRGALLQTVMLLYTCMGIAAGYICSRLYKMFGGVDWKMTTLLCAFLYPGIFFGVFFILNLLIWGQKSSGAVPFTTLFTVLCLWFGVSVPLVFLGAYFGFRKPTIDLPVRTNQLPRQIPAQPFFISSWFTCLVGGTLPFGAVFTELFFIMSSIWQHQFYYVFGFLAAGLVILVITCAEISITFTYFQLTSEDYRWWWRAFLSSGSSALYVFAYAIMYFTSRLQIERLVSTLLYFGYMGIMSVVFFLLTGSVGALASFFFVRAIYGSIKID